MKKSLLMVAVGLLASALSVGAFAGEGAKKCDKEKMHNYMSKVDTNGDGFVSREEYVANAEKRFSKLDANSDGMIDKDEFKAKHKMHKKDKKKDKKAAE